MDAWRAATAQAEQLIAAVKDECIFAELLRTDAGDSLEAAVSAHGRANALWEAVQHRREFWVRQFEGDGVAAASATDTDPATPGGARLGHLSVDGAPFNHDGAGAGLYPGVNAAAPATATIGNTLTSAVVAVNSLIRDGADRPD